MGNQPALSSQAIICPGHFEAAPDRDPCRHIPSVILSGTGRNPACRITSEGSPSLSALQGSSAIGARPSLT